MRTQRKASQASKSVGVGRARRVDGWPGGEAKAAEGGQAGKPGHRLVIY